MADVTCSVNGCRRATASRGLCPGHLTRWRLSGSVNASKPLRIKAPTTSEPAERLWLKIRHEGSCWIWTGARDAGGYGNMTVDGVSIRPHRFAYELLVEPIPTGLHIDHLCRVRACCNPAHLEPVTSAENTRRGVGNGHEVYCPQGHPYDNENTYEWTDKRGYTHRYCRTCSRAHVAASMRKKRAAAIN